MIYQTQTPQYSNTTNYQTAPNKSRVVINSITHLPSPQRPRHLYTPPSMTLHADDLQHAEDTEAGTYLVQSQGQEEEDNISKYLNFKHK